VGSFEVQPFNVESFEVQFVNRFIVQGQCRGTRWKIRDNVMRRDRKQI
jgi:hypothetical protein